MLIVGDDHEGDAHGLLQVDQLQLHGLAQLGIEGGQRLVQQQHLGPFDQRPRQRHTLALATGKLVRHARPIAVQLDQFQGLWDPLGHLPRADTLDLQAIGDILEDRHVREHGVGLEHHIDRAPVRRHRGHVLAIDQDLAFAGHLEAGDHAQKRGFAASRWPEQSKEFALANLEVHLVHRRDIAAEAFGNAFDGNDRIGVCHLLLTFHRGIAFTVMANTNLR